MVDRVLMGKYSGKYEVSCTLHQKISVTTMKYNTQKLVRNYIKDLGAKSIVSISSVPCQQLPLC